MASKSISNKLLENVFIACRCYMWELHQSSYIRIAKDGFWIDNPHTNEFNSFVECIACFKQANRMHLWSLLLMRLIS